MKDYTLHTYADGFGIWHTEIIFLTPMGNTGEAQKVISNAMANAKKQIRKAITQRASAAVRHLSYKISDNQELSTGQLVRLVITEK